MEMTAASSQPSWAAEIVAWVHDHSELSKGETHLEAESLSSNIGKPEIQTQFPHVAPCGPRGAELAVGRMEGWDTRAA